MSPSQEVSLHSIPTPSTTILHVKYFKIQNENSKTQRRDQVESRVQRRDQVESRVGYIESQRADPLSHPLNDGLSLDSKPAFNHLNLNPETDPLKPAYDNPLKPAYDHLSHSEVASYKRISRSITDWQNLVKWINKAFPGLLPPPPPPASIDVNLISKAVVRIIDWISYHESVLNSSGWNLFLQGEFVFQPPSIPSPINTTARPRSLSSLFFSKQALAKEVDVRFDQANVSITAWIQFLSSIGRFNEKIGNLEKELSKLNNEAALRLSALQTYIPSSLQRKATKYHESNSAYLLKDSQFRLSTLNDLIVMAIEGQDILKSSLERRLVALQDYDEACQDTQKKLIVLERLRIGRSIYQDQVDEALNEMTNVKRTEQDAKIVFKDISDSLRNELVDFEKTRDEHMVDMLDDYVKRQIDGCQFLVSILHPSSSTV